jgi:hypothetical protein
MKTIAPPVAGLLAQLHDHAVTSSKLIEAIPALKGDDLPQIVNRVHMLGKLKELEAEFPTPQSSVSADSCTGYCRGIGKRKTASATNFGACQTRLKVVSKNPQRAICRKTIAAKPIRADRHREQITLRGGR